MTDQPRDMPAHLATLIRDAARIFGQHDSAIGHTLSAALFDLHPPYPAIRPHDRLQPCAPPGLRDWPVSELTTLPLCAPYLPWRRPGFGALPGPVADGIAVTEIVGPDGCVPHAALRFGLLFQSPAHHYPSHAHAAEELYRILKGQGLWSVDGQDPVRRGTGTFVHHAPHHPHAMTTTDDQMLCLWGWTGTIDADSYGLKTP